MQAIRYSDPGSSVPERYYRGRIRRTLDGHTLLLVSSSSAANVRLYPKLPFQFERDCAPVSFIAVRALLEHYHAWMRA